MARRPDAPPVPDEDTHERGPAGHGDKETIYTMKVGCINVDYTNRQNGMQGKGLDTELPRAMADIMNNIDIVAVVEVPGICRGKSLLQATGYDGFVCKVGYDTTILASSGDKFHITPRAFPPGMNLAKPPKTRRGMTIPPAPEDTNLAGDYIESAIGKYCATLLTSSDGKCRVLVLASHLPFKGKKLRNDAIVAQLKFVEDAEKLGIDAVINVGDFNAPVEKLANEYRGYTPAFTAEDGPTTATGSRIDNLLSCDAVKIMNKQKRWSTGVTRSTVVTDYTHTTHHPINVDLIFEQ
ncbi:hypothetical protein T492DRAFT_1036128 [Pavlovales sp. CCMP2436]|nr:hypothetical protein T492DRAFT_1036128 [Pavlovales sp. CCMP2436]